MGYWQDGSWKWVLSWRRILFEWEIQDFVRLDTIIERKPPHLGASDGISWRGSNFMDYPIKSIVEKVYDHRDPILPPRCIRSLWHVSAPPRARLTLWFAMLGKLKTGDSLVEKGDIELHKAFCPFCRLEVESNSHVLFTC